MHKAQKELRQRCKDIHVAIEILDSRILHSSSNPLIAQIFADRPRVKLLNKTDLAEPKITQAWQQVYEARGDTCLQIRADKLASEGRLISELEKFAPLDGSPLRCLIVGIPNVGKSTLLNKLAGRKVARTANEPAVTRSQQVIRISDKIRLIDTPGLLWPKLESPFAAYRLAAVSAIKNTAYEYIDVALFVIGSIELLYPGSIAKHFKLARAQNHREPEQILELLGKHWAFRSSGGQVDFERAARKLMLAFHGGELAGYSLESTDMISAEARYLVS